MARKRPAKKPWMKFWTAAWTADTRVLSRTARADWLDMCILMWDGDRRGYLSRDGKPISHAELARHCGCSVDDISRTFLELFSAGIASEKSGIVCCRGMVKYERRCKINKKNSNKRIRPPKQNSISESVSESVAHSLASNFYQNTSSLIEGAEQAAAQLANEWCFLHTGTAPSQKNPYEIRKAIGELIRQGHDARAISKAINHPDRDRSEAFFHFAASFKKPKAKSTDGIAEGIRKLNEMAGTQ